QEFWPLHITIAQLLYTLFLGEAIVPWHWAAPIVVLGFAAPVLLRYGPALLREIRALGSRRALLLESKSVHLALATFAFVLLLAGVAGHHGKGRSYLVLLPSVAFLLSVGMSQVRSPRWRTVVAMVLPLWIGVGMW